MTHYNFVHEFIPDAKAASRMGFEKSEKQKGGHSGSTKRQHQSPLCFIDGPMPSQKCGVGTKFSEVQRTSRCLRLK